MPNTPKILTAFAAVEAALAAMGMENGYHRNYRGVQRTRWGWENEPDPSYPWIQLAARGAPPQSADVGDEFLAPSYFRHSLIFEVAVHLPVEERSDGTADSITPWAEVMADIHAALFADRSLGIAQGCILWYVGTEPEFVATPENRMIGLTVVEVYRIAWDHVGGDMSASS